MIQITYLQTTRRRQQLILSALVAISILLFAFRSPAAIINVTTNDSPTAAYTKIQSAQAGDVVIIAPGTYAFRVQLTGQGSATNPITIRALNPAQKPVWDFGTNLVENAPGSYTAGDRGRGGWQVSGGNYYHISGIIFTNCHTASQNSAGLRYYNGTTGLYLKDCLFAGNDNGLTGGTQNSDCTVEFCEFNHNGNLVASAATHNLYIYAGTFALRYCYVHDSQQAENFHIRAQNSILEYNWFARAANYEGDLMTDDDFSGNGPFTQTMLLRGNVFIQNANPSNPSQVLVIFNDTGLANENMSMQVINNTYVGNGTPGNGFSAAFVHLANSDGTRMNALLMNNIISGNNNVALVDDTVNGAVTGGYNWLTNGVYSGPLTNSVFSSTPVFNNPAAKDYTLAAGSVAIGQAAQTIPELPLPALPIKEYYQNETNARQYRIRATVQDIGAFESTTAGPGIGPHGNPPSPVLTAASSGGTVTISWPFTAADFVVDQAAAVGNSNVWHQFPLPYQTNLTSFGITISGPVSNQFYRLRLP